MIKVELTLVDNNQTRFEDLIQKTGGTPREVIMNALRLYEAVIKEDEEGSTFQKTSKDGQMSEWKPFGE